MPSIQDWAARAARRVDEEYRYYEDHRKWIKPTEARIAAIIATFAEPLVKALQASRISHRHEEGDPWYCCGACTHECDNDEGDHEHDEGCCVESAMHRIQGVCNCGADEHNARIDEALR